MIPLVIGRGAGIPKHIPYKQGVAGSSPAAPTEVTGSPASIYTLVGFLGKGCDFLLCKQCANRKQGLAAKSKFRQPTPRRRQQGAVLVRLRTHRRH